MPLGPVPPSLLSTWMAAAPPAGGLWSSGGARREFRRPPITFCRPARAPLTFNRPLLGGLMFGSQTVDWVREGRSPRYRAKESVGRVSANRPSPRPYLNRTWGGRLHLSAAPRCSPIPIGAPGSQLHPPSSAEEPPQSPCSLSSLLFPARTLLEHPPLGVLGTDGGPSARAASALDHRAISPAQSPPLLKQVLSPGWPTQRRLDLELLLLLPRVSHHTW